METAQPLWAPCSSAGPVPPWSSEGRFFSVLLVWNSPVSTYIHSLLSSHLPHSEKSGSIFSQIALRYQRPLWHPLSQNHLFSGLEQLWSITFSSTKQMLLPLTILVVLHFISSSFAMSFLNGRREQGAGGRRQNWMHCFRCHLISAD